MNGVRTEIPGGYVLTAAHQAGFRVAVYDTSRPHVIDPVLVYSTYLGGSSDDIGDGIAVDAASNAYVAVHHLHQLPDDGGGGPADLRRRLLRRAE